MRQELKVAILSRENVLDVRSLSGATHFMLKALQRQNLDIVPLGPAKALSMGPGRYLDAIARLFRKRYAWGHNTIASREFGRVFSRLLADAAVDVAFAPLSSTEIAFVKTNIPIVYLTDMPFALGRSYYHSFTDLLPLSAREGEVLEKKATRLANRIVVPSEWAAKSLIEHYGCDASRVHVVSYGANLDNPPSREDATTRHDLNVCRLLLLGVDWERKGGPLALEVLKCVLAAGVRAELIVCGCRPPTGVEHPSMKVLPFLRKDNTEEASYLRTLLLTSSFLLVPSRAEAWGFVFGEASACGLPALTRATGGIPSVVREGINGFCFAPEAGPTEYADRIVSFFKDPQAYYAFCRSCRSEYENRLNWDAWARAMVDIFHAAHTSKVDQALASLP